MPEYHGRYAADRWDLPEGRRYSVSHTAEHAVVSLADRVLVGLWNPSSAVPLWVTFIQYDRLSQGNIASENALCYITTQGTASVTVTPDADNDWEGTTAPQSGAVLNHTYSAEPTKAAPRIAGNYFEVSPTAGFSWQWGFTGGEGYRSRRGLLVKPGTGLAIYRLNGTVGGDAMQGYANFVFME